MNEVCFFTFHDMLFIILGRLMTECSREVVCCESGFVDVSIRVMHRVRGGPLAEMLERIVASRASFCGYVIAFPECLQKRAAHPTQVVR